MRTTTVTPTILISALIVIRKGLLIVTADLFMAAFAPPGSIGIGFSGHGFMGHDNLSRASRSSSANFLIRAFANNDECGDEDSWCDSCSPHAECYCTREEAIKMGQLEKYEEWVGRLP